MHGTHPDPQTLRDRAREVAVDSGEHVVGDLLPPTTEARGPRLLEQGIIGGRLADRGGRALHAPSHLGEPAMPTNYQ